MQWISLSAMGCIDTKAKLLARRRDVSRGDLVGIMVMYLAPEDPAELWKLLESYLWEHRRAEGKWKDQALMTRLPSPVSLRLDALVTRAYDIHKTYRQDLVGALARKLPGERRLIKLSDDYHQATAGEAALRGMNRREMLKTEAPEPGRRIQAR